MPARETYSSPFLSNHLTFSVTIALCINVGQEVKAQGKLSLSQAALCQNNAEGVWSSNCGKSLILLIRAYTTHCQSVFRVHRTPLASDPASINDDIDFTKTNPVNEGCGIDPLVACCNKEEFSENTNYFCLVSCSQAFYPLFLPCHCDLNITLVYWLKYLPIKKVSQRKADLYFLQIYREKFSPTLP